MSDEGLDNIFKKSLSERNVNFNMESWRRMEEMLPPEPKAPKFRFGYAAALVGLLLTTSVGVLLWDTDPTDDLALNNSQNIEKNLTEQDLSTKNTKLEANKSIDNNVDVNLNSESNSAASASEGMSVEIEPSENADAKVEASKKPSTVSNKPNYVSSALFTSSKGSSNGFFTDEQINKNHTQNNETYAVEEKVSFASNSFTHIQGVEELLTLSGMNEETNIVIADVSNEALPTVDKNVFGFIGGINFNQSLVESPNSGIYVSELLGVEYQRYFNGGLSLKADLLYSARAGLNTSKTYDKKEYDFGSRTEQSTVECQRIVYMELPVLLNYGVANHNFMVGPSFSYFVSSLNKVTTTYETPTSSNTEESMVWGKTDGFKPYDFAIVAGYEYSLKPRLNLGVRLNYGLIDVTENSYFKNESFDNNVQVRVYLTFSPFQF